MTSFWCEAAIIAGKVERSVRIEETDGVITAVEPASQARVGDIPLVGLVLPGLANGHSHAFHRALRGRTHDDGGTFWTWREQMYSVAAQLDPSQYEKLATAVFAEMLLAGYTVVGEFHYVHHRTYGTPYPNGAEMEQAILAAAAAVGIRLTLLDTIYLGGGVGDSTLGDAQRRFSDETVGAWAERRDAAEPGPLARIGSGIHSVRAVPPSLFAEIASASVGMPLHAHVSERHRPHTDRAVRQGRPARPRLHGRSWHPSERNRHCPARRDGEQCLLHPDDRTRPRRRDRTGFGASGCRRETESRQRPERRYRPV
jgi:formiminoglutamate deiminase